MKIIRTIFITLFVVVLLAVIAGFTYLSLNGRQLIEENLARAFQRPVKIGEVSIVPPFGLSVDGFDVAGTFHAKQVIFQLNIPVVQDKDLMLAKVELQEPVVQIRRTADGKLIFGEQTLLQKQAEQTAAASAASTGSPSAAPAETVPPVVASKIPPMPAAGIIIDRLVIRDGNARFENQMKGSELRLNIEKVELVADNVVYPLKPVKTGFQAAAVISGEGVPFSGSQAQAVGWVNWPGRNMDGKFKITRPDGTLILATGLQSVANDMMVRGKVNLGQLLGQLTVKEDKPESFERVLVEALQSSGLDLAMNFSFRTKMDDFHLEPVAFNGNAAYATETTKGQPTDLKAISEQVEAFGKKFYEEPAGDSSAPAPTPGSK